MSTEIYFHQTNAYRFTRYAIFLAWGFVIFNLIDLHFGVCKSLVEIPIAGFVCVLSWVFGYGLKLAMLVASITSIGLMFFCKKIDYTLLFLLITSFIDAYYQGLL